MVAQRPKVILRDIHYRYQHYFDYLVTGFGLLAENSEIDFLHEPLLVSKAVQWHPRAIGFFQRAFPRLERELARGDNWCISGEVHLKDRRVKFAFDVDDSPYQYQIEMLNSVDVYFKCQCPVTFDPIGFPLTSRVRIPYHPDVLELRQRILPAMLGRPLSRTLNFRRNVKILMRWESFRGVSRNKVFLAYFGTDRLPTEREAPNEFTLLSRYRDALSHPNLKRQEIVAWLKSRFNGDVDARIVETESTLLRGPEESDNSFPGVLARSMFNVNISGFRRSIPFRFTDSFMLGTSVVSDELAIRWYKPFETDVEVTEIGKLGYELERDAEWTTAKSRLSELAQNAASRYREIRPAILNNFDKHWHPRVFARYILDECLRRA